MPPANREGKLRCGPRVPLSRTATARSVLPPLLAIRPLGLWRARSPVYLPFAVCACPWRPGKPRVHPHPLWERGSTGVHPQAARRQPLLGRNRVEWFYNQSPQAVYRVSVRPPYRSRGWLLLLWVGRVALSGWLLGCEIYWGLYALRRRGGRGCYAPTLS